ncbi:hypothetical protein CCICO_10240 [Corynebacterium ciconiae DSM 44920]|uniref:hypothetical protein n=1 Tax=Corynebacterium ciconiae TaxID=227319 RepID=UPI000377E8DB|nr:hypothetical protein [Corynebacterium ciconiae]WKD62047.1 hypothetical protein CCICO_10240 [Corynebacterium ciconiae DSM 44920]
MSHPTFGSDYNNSWSDQPASSRGDTAPRGWDSAPSSSSAATGSSSFGGGSSFAQGSSAPGPSGQSPWDSGDQWGAQQHSPAATQPRLNPVSGPWPLLIIAGVTSLIGILCAVAAPVMGGTATDDGFRTLALVGWVFAGILTFVAIGFHKIADNRRKAESFYVENTAQTALLRAALALGAVSVVITAIEFALAVSKTVGA